ncbi:class I SAM-dependent methyltransferase, partial [candidate division GN15 bacterium]|nr:class I SAM-dependent methyltransferase [candidate division GN15 bacterium]
MLYDYPQYYQAAFAFRDIERETTFLAETIDRYSAVPVDRVLEIGCGPAPHAGELIRRGYHYLGLDNSRVMLNYASETWRR